MVLKLDNRRETATAREKGVSLALLLALNLAGKTNMWVSTMAPLKELLLEPLKVSLMGVLTEAWKPTVMHWACLDINHMFEDILKIFLEFDIYSLYLVLRPMHNFSHLRHLLEICLLYPRTDIGHMLQGNETQLHHILCT